MSSDRQAKWLAERNNLIGASETPSILGCGFESAASVWARKVGVNVEHVDSIRMFIGNALQAGIVEIARHVMQLPIIDEKPFKVRKHKKIKYIGASLDAYIDENGVHVPLDAKNVDRQYADDWKNEPPIGYQVQLQQQMFVTGATYGYLFALIGGNDPVWHRVERNDSFIEAMLARLDEFWKLVKSKTPPPYQDPADQSKVLAALYPRDTGTSISLSSDAVRILNRREEVAEMLKEIQSEKESCDNALKILLADNAYGRLPDGRWVSWKTQQRKEYTVAASTSRVLRVHDKAPKDAPALSAPEYTIDAITHSITEEVCQPQS